MPPMRLIASVLLVSSLPQLVTADIAGDFAGVAVSKTCPQKYRSGTGRCKLRVAFVPQEIFAMPGVDGTYGGDTFAEEALHFTKFDERYAAGHAFSDEEMAGCFTQQTNCPASGMDMDIMVKIFAELDWDFTLVAYKNYPTALYATRAGIVDMGWFAAAVTGKREACAGCPIPADPLKATSENVCCLDFSYPYAEGGLALASKGGGSPTSLISALMTVRMLNVSMLFLLLLMITGHLMWAIESRTELGSVYFPKAYLHGVFQGIYWSCTTATTVGYGDTGPTTGITKIFTMIWMFVGIVLSGTVAGLMSSALTVSDLQNLDISSLDELKGQSVCFIPGYYDEYMAKEGASVRARRLNTITDCVASLNAGSVDAILYEKHSLDRYINNGWLGDKFAVTDIILPVDYGVAFEEGSELRNRVSAALLGLTTEGTFMTQIKKKWLGDGDAGTDDEAADEEVNWNLVYCVAAFLGWLILANIAKFALAIRTVRGRGRGQTFSASISEAMKEDRWEAWRTPAFNMIERAVKESIGEIRGELKEMKEQQAEVSRELKEMKEQQAEVSRNQQKLLAEAGEGGAALVARMAKLENRIDQDSISSNRIEGGSPRNIDTLDPTKILTPI